MALGGEATPLLFGQMLERALLVLDERIHEMTQVGVIKEIWRYPVKSMFGERVERSVVDLQGFPDDRQWALRDEETGVLLGGKRVPKIMTLAARYRGQPTGGFGATANSLVEIVFPDGRSMLSDDPYISAAISMYLGRRVTLHPRLPESAKEHYATKSPMSVEETRHYLGMRADGPNPDLSDFPLKMLDVMSKYVTPPGTYYDVYPLHFMTTASLAQMKSFYDGDFRVERYRPNFLIETEEGAEGFAEFGWEGRRLRIGSLEVECLHRTIRCSQPGAEQVAGIDQDPNIPQAVMRYAGQNLGAYGRAKSNGQIKVGDIVELLPDSFGAVRYHFLRPLKSKAKTVLLSRMVSAMEAKQRKAPKATRRTYPIGFEPFRISSVVQESDDVRSIYLESTSGAHARFVPGQHLTLAIPARDTTAKTYRPYSISSGAEELSQYRISVKHESTLVDGVIVNGVGSDALHHQLNVGDVIHVKGPSGSFGVLPQDTVPLILMCNGIGITPFLSILHTLAATHPQRRVDLFYGVRSAPYVAFDKELVKLKSLLPNLRLHVFVSQAQTRDWRGCTFDPTEMFPGRISTQSVLDRICASEDRHFLICGSVSFASDMRAGLEAAGVPASRIDQEAFAQARARSAPSDGARYLVRFSRSEVDATWSGSQENLLNLAEEMAVPCSSGCRYGACQACEATLVSGDVEYLGDIERPAGKGRILLCSVRPKSDLVIDL